MSKEMSILHFYSKDTLLLFRQFLNLLMLFYSQGIKDLNHPLRGLFNGDGSSHIC